MQRKQNESELGRMMRRYGFYAHKWRDRGYMACPHCHRPITKCPHCRADTLLPKAETKPDFLVAFDYIYVEGKGATDRWNWDESITPNQRRVMEEHESWLFLEIGTGRAPAGREAYLFPWEDWKLIEAGLESEGFSSLIHKATPRSRNPEALAYLHEYALIWDEGDWAIPQPHLFWQRHPDRSPYERALSADHTTPA